MAINHTEEVNFSYTWRQILVSVCLFVYVCVCHGMYLQRNKDDEMIEIAAQSFLLHLLLIMKEMVCPCLHFHVPSVNTCLDVFCACFVRISAL